MISTEPPDFRDWREAHLQLLLADYRESLKSIKILYGKRHPEYLLYCTWIKAIEEELRRR